MGNDKYSSDRRSNGKKSEIKFNIVFRIRVTKEGQSADLCAISFSPFLAFQFLLSFELPLAMLSYMRDSLRKNNNGIRMTAKLLNNNNPLFMLAQ